MATQELDDDIIAEAIQKLEQLIDKGEYPGGVIDGPESADEAAAFVVGEVADKLGLDRNSEDYEALCAALFAVAGRHFATQE